MPKKVILMILFQKFLPDIRVEQEYNALKEAGYRVIVIADKNGWEDNNYEIIRIDPRQRWSNWFNMTLSFNPILKSLITKELIRKGVEHVDVIHVHDLFWAFLGLNLKRYFNCKLVIDLHENYPEFIKNTKIRGKIGEMLKTKKQKANTIVRDLIHPHSTILAILQKQAYSIKRLFAYEDHILQKCDRFIVVVKESLDRFKQKDYYKTGIIVSNTKDPGLWSFKNLPDLNKKLKVTYVGTVQDLRGLDTAIMAMKYLNQEEYELNIVGIKLGSLIHKDFLRIMEEYKIRNVNLVEWLENESAAFSYINNSHICIIPHKNSGLTQTTIPHKLFMYMAIGRPVLVSDVAPLKRIVSESNCGLVFKAEDPCDFSDKLKKMKNTELLQQLAINGRRAIENTYNWAHDKERLLKMYSELCS